eukprot:gene18617-biopygen15990
MQRPNVQRSTVNGPTDKTVMPNGTGMFGVSVISNGLIVVVVVHFSGGPVLCAPHHGASYGVVLFLRNFNMTPGPESHLPPPGNSLTLSGTPWIAVTRAELLLLLPPAGRLDLRKGCAKTVVGKLEAFCAHPPHPRGAIARMGPTGDKAPPRIWAHFGIPTPPPPPLYPPLSRLVVKRRPNCWLSWGHAQG